MATALSAMLTGSALYADVVNGLRQKQKYIPCKWLYDAAGSALFEEITHLSAYYPYRTELSILAQHARSIAQLIGGDATLIEYGAGNAIKTELLLAQLAPPATYLAIDVDIDLLGRVKQRLNTHLPDLSVLIHDADFTQHFELPKAVNSRHRVGLFCGSTIGNLSAEQVRRFLALVRHHVGRDGSLIIGLDLRKDIGDLLHAYDDPNGVTEAFNKNLLVRINRELGANFNVEQFSHHVYWNSTQAAIEMHLISQCRQQVRIGHQQFEFSHGESILTESCRKFLLIEFSQFVAKHGWMMQHHWSDTSQRFAVVQLVAQ